MATFDQLPADQRAILELVIGRGQTYDELSEMLGMPPARVRELARQALGELAPATAARVDADWRGQIADYILGQQTGPESTATRGHFKRSEPARAWAYSLLDSLSHLYPNGAMPAIPEPGATERAAPAPPPPRTEPELAPERERPAAAAPPAPPSERERPAAAAPPAPPTRRRPSGPAGLSPAARAIVMRRRLIGGALAVAAIVVVVLLVTGVFSGGGGSKRTSTTAPPVKATAYEVWLYNSGSDATPLGAQFTDAQGNLQGRGAVPGNWQRFGSVVLSRERVGTNPRTPTNLVLRAGLSAVRTKNSSGRTARIIREGVFKPAGGESGTGIAIILEQGSQHQLVVQATRLQPTSTTLPSSGQQGSGSGTTTSP